MKIETTMCYTHLMSMLMMPEQFNKAVNRYEASAPNVEHEGIIGYIETSVKFEVKDLEKFSELWYKAYKLPSDRQSWYYNIRNGLECK